MADSKFSVVARLCGVLLVRFTMAARLVLPAKVATSRRVQQEVRDRQQVHHLISLMITQWAQPPLVHYPRALMGVFADESRVGAAAADESPAGAATDESPVGTAADESPEGAEEVD